MTFEELLTVLLGWTGRRVQVAVATTGETPVTVAMIEGALAGCEELSDGGADAVAFSFADAPAGFIVSGAVFEGAGWHERDRSTLVVHLSAVTLWIGSA